MKEIKVIKAGQLELSLDDIYMNAAEALSQTVDSDMYLYYENIEDIDTEIICYDDNIIYYNYGRQGFPFAVPHLFTEMEDAFEIEDEFEAFEIRSPYCFTYSLKDKKLLSFNFLDAISSPDISYSFQYSPDDLSSGFRTLFTAQFFKDISYLAVHYSEDTLYTLDSYNML